MRRGGGDARGAAVSVARAEGDREDDEEGSQTNPRL